MKKYIFTAILAVASLLIFKSPVIAKTWPQPTGYINDYAQIISDAVEDDLEDRLRSLEASSSQELSVVTLNSLEGDTVENVAVDIFSQWGIGKKDKDNGVLLLIAFEDRKLKIEVGYGLEPILTDSRSGTIIRDIITPEFKQDNYEAGIVAGVDAIIQVISEDSTVFDQKTTQPDGDDKFVLLPLIFLIFFVYTAAFLGRSKRFWPGGVLGFIIGLFFFNFIGAIFSGLWGLFLDFILSKTYTTRKKKGLSTKWWSSGGGFSSGSGGGFGGFSGGSSGGGGASGSW